MTEKRFIGSSGGVYDKYNDNRLLWSEWEEIIKVMNNLDTKARERSKALGKLQKENEQLKKDIKQIHTYIDNAILTERTRMGKNCLKQLKEGLQ